MARERSRGGETPVHTASRVGAFGAGVVLVFGLAYGAGRAVGPIGTASAEDRHGMHGEHASTADAVPGGLQVAERGYRLVLPGGPLAAGTPTDFRFRILGPDGTPLTRYATEHGKRLHLIVAGRDLAGYRHVHPTLGADGNWRVPLTFAAAGPYRVFADFAPAGDPDGGLTLGGDVAVTGTYAPHPLPAPARTATVDGYTVTLAGDLTPGAASTLTLSVSRDGRPVTDLEPYLAAYGHLVALRAGDLAYLHVHPDGEPGDGHTRPGPAISFHAEVPSAGAYRLYLDFKHHGSVHTAEFTAVAAKGAASR
jgi:hypothetical protein